MNIKMDIYAYVIMKIYRQKIRQILCCASRKYVQNKGIVCREFAHGENK